MERAIQLFDLSSREDLAQVIATVMRLIITISWFSTESASVDLMEVI